MWPLQTLCNTLYHYVRHAIVPPTCGLLRLHGPCLVRRHLPQQLLNQFLGLFWVLRMAHVTHVGWQSNATNLKPTNHKSYRQEQRMGYMARGITVYIHLC